MHTQHTTNQKHKRQNNTNTYIYNVRLCDFMTEDIKYSLFGSCFRFTLKPHAMCNALSIEHLVQATVMA